MSITLPFKASEVNPGSTCSEMLCALSTFAAILAVSLALNIDGRVICPEGFSVFKTDVTIHPMLNPDVIIYQNTDASTAGDFCVSTNSAHVDKFERLVLTVEYTCRMLSKICVYSDRIVLPFRLTSRPFTPRFYANEKVKLSCGRLNYDPDEIEKKTLIFGGL